MNIKEPCIIAVDMDGTLLNKRKGISLKTLFYLRKLGKLGHKVILASGRPSRALTSYYKKLHLNTPMICYNGAYVYSPCDSNFKPVEFQYPRNLILNVLDNIKTHIFNVMCETDTEIWVDKEDNFLAKFFWYEKMTVHVGDLHETLTKDPMTCIVQTPFEYRNTNEIDTILEKFPEVGARFWTGSPYFELYHKKTSKGSSLQLIAKYYNIPRERIIAFGDSNNDIEMFDFAGISVFMSNGTAKIENATMRSVKDNNHNGIYYTLKKLFS